MEERLEPRPSNRPTRVTQMTIVSVLTHLGTDEPVMDQRRHPMDESPVARLVTLEGVAPNQTAGFESRDFDYPPVSRMMVHFIFDFSIFRFKSFVSINFFFLDSSRAFGSLSHSTQLQVS